jgi:hypothetical protein
VAIPRASRAQAGPGRLKPKLPHLFAKKRMARL